MFVLQDGCAFFVTQPCHWRFNMYSDEIVCGELKRIADSLEAIHRLLNTRQIDVPRSQSRSGNEMLTSEEAAKYLGINKHTLGVWRSTKRYNVPVIKVGRAVRYKRSDLELWLATRRPD
jgi:excisionase family DNA binding protein